MNFVPPPLARVGFLGLALGLVLLGSAGADTVSSARNNAAPPAPPRSASPVSPVTIFRQLLAQPPAGREALLANRSESQRETLRRRLAEYEALPADQREQRLQATDLYWHLQQLIRRPASERQPFLAAAPTELHPVLEERLALWDRLPESDRQALRDHEQAVRYFARWKSLPPTPPTPPLPGPSLGPSPAVSLQVQSELARLQQLPPEARQRTFENWRRFFDTPSPRDERALQTMSVSEREEMQEALRKFRSLPPTQRQTCIDSFARLASLPPTERADFLRRAERWEALTAGERAAWRRLVTLLPPLPPSPESAAPSTPPLPPTAPRPTLLTNAQPGP